MTYSLDTLNNTRAAAAPARGGVSRFAHEIGLVLGAAALLFWLLALITYSQQDPAFSTSGDGLGTRNLGGHLGAWIGDASYFLLGFSAWWCVAAGLRSWMASLARWMRADTQPDAAAPTRRERLAFWCGLTLLLCASTALEWSRLYRLEPRLPDHAGGALGAFTGRWGVEWLGFTGSGLVFVALAVVGSAMVFRFSWGQVAERLGARIDGWFEARREQREKAEDVALGQRAAKQREEIVLEERIEIEEHHPAPVLIEPVKIEAPKSERVVKERQKPLFTELPDSKLPQVDLLDSPLGRQETVSSETLEMTSRLIEKKL
ncbi:DNA translocase FtsK 4TM domain-containing protein, partial [Ramlibacter sp.]|uniref:DNA translocase FtsK 4TM domain-containing protein n=1 Tax=Ramlibacter sp. TaxID=1917967 RepID=UPI002B71F32D